MALVPLLASCGGGGGGAGAGQNLPVAQSFTAWSAVAPSQRVTAQGMSTTASFTATLAGDVTIVSAFGPANTSGSSATFTTSQAFTPTPNPDLTAFQLTAPAGTVSWDEAIAGGGTVACGGGLCTASSSAAEATFVDPYAQPGGGWNYQSFGVWSSGTGMGGAVGTIGAMSFGAPTPIGTMPTNLIATYNGLTAGVYVDGNKQLFGTSASMSAVVNINGGVGTVGFSTTGTQISNAGGPLGPQSKLDLVGNLTYNGAGQFTGTVNSSNAGDPQFQLSGTASGRFYGPAAEEIGGVYSLTGTGGHMGGAFGGKK